MQDQTIQLSDDKTVVTVTTPIAPTVSQYTQVQLANLLAQANGQIQQFRNDITGLEGKVAFYTQLLAKFDSQSS